MARNKKSNKYKFKKVKGINSKTNLNKVKDRDTLITAYEYLVDKLNTKARNIRKLGDNEADFANKKLLFLNSKKDYRNGKVIDPSGKLITITDDGTVKLSKDREFLGKMDLSQLRQYTKALQKLHNGEKGSKNPLFSVKGTKYLFADKREKTWKYFKEKYSDKYDKETWNQIESIKNNIIDEIYRLSRENKDYSSDQIFKQNLLDIITDRDIRESVAKELEYDESLKEFERFKIYRGDNKR